ncbi:MAG: response regulator [Dehalococcoidia bacterium]
MATVRNILVVEDEESVRLAIVAGLDVLGGFSVMTAADGMTGLQMIKTNHPDVLLIDLLLPGLDGIEVLSALRALGEATRPSRVVLMTAHANPVPEGSIQDLGADALLAKPFRLADLARAIGDES